MKSAKRDKMRTETVGLFVNDQLLEEVKSVNRVVDNLIKYEGNPVLTVDQF